MRKRYYVGHCIKDIELFANVEIVNEKEDLGTRKFNTLKIEITFKKQFTHKELKDHGIELPYYTRKGGTKWIFQISERNQLIPELNRLNNNGFKIPDPKNNLEIHKLVANWI